MWLDDDGVPLPDRRMSGKRGALIVVYTSPEHGENVAKISGYPVYYLKPESEGSAPQVSKDYTAAI